MSVDAGDVIEIMDTDLDESEVIPFLKDIQDEYSNLNDRATKWAAAHLTSMIDQRKAKEKGGPVSVTYEGKTVWAGSLLDMDRWLLDLMMLIS